VEQITKQDALDYCLDNPDGLSVDELVGRFPEYGAELRPLVGFSALLRGAAPPLPSEARRAAMKARLLQGLPPPRVAPAPPRLSPWRLFAQQLAGQWMRRPVWAAGVVALVLLLALGGRAAAAALPDSPLYGAKLGVENVLLAFSPSGADHAQGHLDSANRRLGDMDSMRVAGRFAEAGPAIANYDSHLGGAVQDWRRLSGAPQLHVTEALYVSSVAAKHTFASIDGAVAGLPPAAQAEAQATIRQVDSLNAETTRALVAAGVDPQALLLDDNPNLVRTLQEAHLDPASLQQALAPAATATAVQQAVLSATPAAPAAPAPAVAVGAPSPSTMPPGATATPPPAVAQGGRAATATAVPGAGITARPVPSLPPAPAGGGAPPSATGAPPFGPPPTVTYASAPPASATRAAATATRPPPTLTSSPASPTSVAPPALATAARHTPEPGPPSHTPGPVEPSHTPRPVEPSHTPGPPTFVALPSHTPGPPTAAPATAVIPPSQTPVRPTEVPPSDTPVPPTREPRPSQTPGPPPSHTPRPAPSDTPIPPPTDTPVPPPSSTPVPPTDTPVPPTATDTAVPPTWTPLPTETPDPDICNLEVEQVRLSCSAPECGDWTATVANAASGPVRANWTASLQIRGQTGPFHTVVTTHGVAIFPAGGGEVADQICYSFPPDTARMKVIFTLSGASDGCRVQGSSNAIAPCQ
jgi:hypothetical protein